MEFGDMFLRLLSWVILALAMSRCHGSLEAERLALLQIKASINHPNGTSLPEWKDGNTDNYCDWSGVECHKATRFVIALDLYGERQDELGNWCLNASLFRPFESLTKLHLAHNGLIICIDDEGVENQLSKLRNLKVLDLWGNNLDSRVLSFINGLTSLISLDLSDNHLNDSIHLKAIRRDFAARLSALDLKNLQDDEQQEQFWLIETQTKTSGPSLPLPDPSKFPPAPPPELQVHHLHYHHHSGRDAGVAGEDGRWVVEDGLAGDKGLDAVGDSIDGSEILSLNLTNLEVLDLTYTQLDKSIISSLHGLSSLRSLNLSDNNLGGSSHMRDSTGGFRNLSLNLRNLEELNLGGNQLDNNILSSLHGFSSLKGLYLDNNNLKASHMQDSTGGFRNFSLNLRNLEELSLGGNQLDNSILSSLHGFSSLKGLYLDNNNLKASHMQVY
ncbi:hypothetical protein RJ639_021214 [Escallonia herrerae]|uniref:Leucine-rich repeat-containing N-terminal plant-type domain-containing protein n=1 Tax=Escallonia herrerae TaxID=1293975 RepID=A0AA88V6K6_9ASTE|nr:hypothetical protein RJ639_021214 [Escallonia herrerae]